VREKGAVQKEMSAEGKGRVIANQGWRADRMRGFRAEAWEEKEGRARSRVKKKIKTGREKGGVPNDLKGGRGGSFVLF